MHTATYSPVEPMKQVTWPQVILALGLTLILLTTVVILSINDKDPGAILGSVSLVVLSLLAVFGLDARNKLDHKMDQVKETANGRLTEALNMIEKQQVQITALALATQPPPPAPPSANSYEHERQEVR